MAEDILALPQVQAAVNDTFIVDVIRRSRLSNTKRRRTTTSSSRSFQHIAGLAGEKESTPLGIQIPSFDVNAAASMRDGMSTPTDQTFSHDYAHYGSPFTPSNKK